jgi:hypothetical protein
MKKLLTVTLSLSLAAPLFAATMKSLPLVDTHCGEKVKSEADADKHDRSCMLMCEKNGYAVYKDGKLLKLDAKGNELAAAALKASKKKDHLRVTVDGEVKGDTLAVTSLALD